MTDIQPITADPGDVFWRYEVPARTDAKVLLLTKGGIAVSGNWTGRLGEFFCAWAPLPKRDKKRERELGFIV